MTLNIQLTLEGDLGSTVSQVAPSADLCTGYMRGKVQDILISLLSIWNYMYLCLPPAVVQPLPEIDISSSGDLSGSGVESGDFSGSGVGFGDFSGSGVRFGDLSSSEVESDMIEPTMFPESEVFFVGPEELYQQKRVYAANLTTHSDFGVVPQVEGIYTCVAQNELGNSTQSINLNVRGKLMTM